MEKIAYTNVLKKRNFFLLWLACAITSFGDSLSTIALIGLIVWFTKGAKEINMMWLMLSLLIPQIVFGPIAGVFVDRWRRKWIMIASDLIRGILVFLIIFTQATYQVFVIAFLVSLVDIFFFPARSSFLPNIVDKKELIVANPLLSSTQEFMNLIGPAIGGVIIGFFGIKSLFVIDALTFLLSATAILFISIKEESKEEKMGIKPLFLELKEGIGCIKTSQKVSFICFVFGAMMIAGGAINLILPIFVSEILHKGTAEFGFLMSANGLGIIIGSLLGGRLAQRINKIKLITFAVILCGINSVIFALNPLYLIGLFLFVINGLSNGLWEVSATTLLQEETDDRNRGKVFSVVGAITGSTNIFSSGISGILAKILGVKVLFLGAGLFMSIVGILGKIRR
ncbi:MAG: MFS transporter [bacterium]